MPRVVSDDSVEWDAEAVAPTDDAFAGWNLGAAPITGNVVGEPAWWDKYQLPMLPSAAVGRGGGACPPVAISEIAVHEGGGVWRARLRGNEWCDKD